MISPSNEPADNTRGDSQKQSKNKMGKSAEPIQLQHGQTPEPETPPVMLRQQSRGTSTASRRSSSSHSFFSIYSSEMGEKARNRGRRGRGITIERSTSPSSSRNSHISHTSRNSSWQSGKARIFSDEVRVFSGSQERRISRLSSPSSHVSHGSGNSSIPGDGARRIAQQHEYSKNEHQRLENGRKTPPLPPTATMSSVSAAASTDTSTSQWDGAAHKAAIDAAKTNLFVTLTRTGDDNAPKTATLNIATAQRLLLAGYQQRLTKVLHEVITTEDDERAQVAWKSMDTLLYNYCKPFQAIYYVFG